MIFGKINPVASAVRQTGPFSTITTTGSYIAAIARPYILGSSQVDFQVAFGEVTLNESNTVIGFKTILNSEITLSGSVISSWGTDDATMLSTIATELGTTVESTVIGDLNNF